jgi:hypothetical protein
MSFRPDVVEAIYCAFGRALEAAGASQLEALVASFCFFRGLEASLTPEQLAVFRKQAAEIERKALQ